MTFLPALVRALAVISTLSVLAATASENSPSVIIPAPTGDVPSTLSVDKIAVRVKDMAVEIQYTLKNTGKKIASPRLTIYGSLFGWEGVDSAYPDKAFLELRVTIDQKPIKTTTNVMALYQGEPVNAKLSSLHLDPLWIARNPDPFIETSSLSKKRLRAAIQEGLIRDLGQGLVPN